MLSYPRNSLCKTSWKRWWRYKWKNSHRLLIPVVIEPGIFPLFWSNWDLNICFPQVKVVKSLETQNYDEKGPSCAKEISFTCAVLWDLILHLRASDFLRMMKHCIKPQETWKGLRPTTGFLSLRKWYLQIWWEMAGGIRFWLEEQLKISDRFQDVFKNMVYLYSEKQSFETF